MRSLSQFNYCIVQIELDYINVLIIYSYDGMKTWCTAEQVLIQKFPTDKCLLI